MDRRGLGFGRRSARLGVVRRGPAPLSGALLAHPLAAPVAEVGVLRPEVVPFDEHGRARQVGAAGGCVVALLPGLERPRRTSASGHLCHADFLPNPDVPGVWGWTSALEAVVIIARFYIKSNR